MTGINIAPWLGLAVVVLVGAWWLAVYNRLVKLRQLIANSWSNVETELKRRYDLIPGLVETVKGYAAHERSVFESVVAARSAAVATNGESPVVQEPAENDLVGQLRRLLAVAEAYPELKASSHFLALQSELTNTEDRIQLARRIYNANVRDNNVLVESVPSNLVASVGGFQRAAFFEVSPVESQPPEVDLNP